MDMDQYTKLFTTARYPQEGEDYVDHPLVKSRLSRYLPFVFTWQIVTLKPEPYVMVMSNKQFFVLDVLDRATNRPLTVKELQHQLDRIIHESHQSHDGRVVVHSLFLS